MITTVTTIILDCGHVLTRPASGNWFIPSRYKEIFPPDFLRDMIVGNFLLNPVFEKPYQYLNDHHHVTMESEEYAQFTEFYRQLLVNLDYAGDIGRMSGELAREKVYNDGEQIFFGDVAEYLPKFREKYRLCLISDTWPSLRRIFRNRDLLKYFDGFFMSCDYGMCKDTPRFFVTVIAEAGIEPDKAIFVDDYEGNLVNAQKAGLRPVLMDRYGAVKKSVFPIIRGLDEIERVIANVQD